MAFDIGDRIIYEGEDVKGEYLQGEIIDIAKNNRDMITSYFAVLNSGLYVQFRPHNLMWTKLDKPLLKRRIIQTSPLLVPVMLKRSVCL
ncbi:hypothetical protein ACFLXY_06240 [Chloroflexota bacterium]